MLCKSREAIKVLPVFFTYVLLLVLTTCSCGGSPDSSSEGLSNDDGILSLSLTDGTTDEYKAVYITLDHVEVYIPDSCRR